MAKDFRLAVLLIIPVLLNPTGPEAGAQETPSARRAAILRSAKMTFDAIRTDWRNSKHRIHQQVLREFEGMIAEVDRAEGWTDEARAERRKEIQAARAQFVDRATFPPDARYDDIALTYCKAANDASLEIFDRLAELDEQAKARGLEYMADAVESYEADLDAFLGAIGRPKCGSRWRGTFKDSDGEVVHYQVEFSKVADGGAFIGNVEDGIGAGVSSSHAITGRIQGSRLEYQKAATPSGPKTSVQAIGHVCGDRLFAEVTRSVGPSEPRKIRFVLRKVE